MSEFWIYFKIGLNHVLDIHGYDHVLFLIALTVPYAFKDWSRILILVTINTAPSYWSKVPESWSNFFIFLKLY